MEGDRVLLISDSVSLGAGQYTTKSLEVETEDDLHQVYFMFYQYRSRCLLFLLNILIS